LSGWVRDIKGRGSYLDSSAGAGGWRLTVSGTGSGAAESASLSGAHRDLLTSFLEQCDQVKFAAYHPEQSESKDALAASRRFLEETRLVPDQEDESRRPAA